MQLWHLKWFVLLFPFQDIRRASDGVRYNHPYRKFVNTIIDKCPTTFQDSLTKHLDDFQDYDSKNSSPIMVSVVKIADAFQDISLKIAASLFYVVVQKHSPQHTQLGSLDFQV